MNIPSIPFLQIPAQSAGTPIDSLATVNNPVTTPTKANLSIMDLALKGGWIMIVLAVLSLLAIYIFVRKVMEIRAAGREDNSFMERIKDYIHEGKIESAMRLCQDRATPSARMIAKGITRLGRPMNDILVAVENTGNIEIGKLEKGLPIIATAGWT